MHFFRPITLHPYVHQPDKMGIISFTIRWQKPLCIYSTTRIKYFFAKNDLSLNNNCPAIKWKNAETYIFFM